MSGLSHTAAGIQDGSQAVRILTPSPYFDTECAPGPEGWPDQVARLAEPASPNGGERDSDVVTDTPPLTSQNARKLRAVLADFNQKAAAASQQEELLFTLSTIEHI